MSSREILMQQMDTFFTRYWDNNIMLEAPDIISSLKGKQTPFICNFYNGYLVIGLHYLDLPYDEFRKLIESLHNLEYSFPTFKCIGSCLLYKHKIVWNGLPGIDSLGKKDDGIYTLIEYLTHPTTGQLDDGIIAQNKPKGEVLCYCISTPLPLFMLRNIFKSVISSRPMRLSSSLNTNLKKTSFISSLNWKAKSSSEGFTGWIIPPFVKAFIDGASYYLTVYQVPYSYRM
jgi:hypothetical protein